MNSASSLHGVLDLHNPRPQHRKRKALSAQHYADGGARNVTTPLSTPPPSQLFPGWAAGGRNSRPLLHFRSEKRHFRAWVLSTSFFAVGLVSARRPPSAVLTYGASRAGGERSPSGRSWRPRPEDERRVFRECNQESFWYRSLPMSAVAVMGTQILINKGILTTNSRFGSLPKLAFAGLCGYLGGKFSYMKACQEKFKKLENSPLGEALRQRGSVTLESSAQKRESSDVPYSSPFETSPAAKAPPSSMYSGDNRGMEYSRSKYEPVPFSSSMNESTPTGITDSVPQEPSPSLEASPKRKEITYDELRSRNRELYEAGITQKSELPSKSLPERLPKKEVKVNKYGDAWEE